MNLLLPCSISFFISIAFPLCFCTPYCLDENGNEVDWYVIYKLPLLVHHENDKIAHGVAYTFITSETVEKGWQLSNVAISDPESIPGRTLSFIFSGEDHNEIYDFFWIFYNDQPPLGPATFQKGHTKGIVAGNHDGGFWLVHSVPRFPLPHIHTYTYPDTGKRYGQSFLCISMKQSTLDSVGDQLITNWANIFNSSIPPALEQLYPSLVQAVQEKPSTWKTHKELLYSVRNKPFLSFAKSKKFGADLYSAWVADVLSEELYVETWLHQDKLPSECNTSYPVHNIEEISLSIGDCKFENYNDHSKYAVSNTTNGKNWVCIGDINRASSQFMRGGGTVCVDDHNLWSAYNKMIVKVEDCPRKLQN